ncbi:MAG TPA: heavy metal-associated domain-containing protein [Gemmatales bacterium]|nr:heavy metal-associated domain-containing protein [Gemmatales bacterium]
MSAIQSIPAVALVASLFLLGSTVQADGAKSSDKNVTTIKVGDMTCGGCAKKVQQTLAKLTGVQKVESDVTTHTVKVFPKENAKVSSKELWEAVEKAGYTPSELDGPAGSFKEKPKS